MRQLTQVESNRQLVFTSRGVESALIEPTINGLNKSIMDATQPVREYLKQCGVHDYTTQKQGPESKVLLNSFIFTDSGIVESTASLYRPVTKSGDPRIWFRGLTSHCRPNDIISIVYYDNALWLFNLTQLDAHTIYHNGGPFRQLIEAYDASENIISNELLNKLRGIASRGFIPAGLQADTSIGRLLETELGIAINSSRSPDYKGIEIKSYRSKRNNRMNLFAQVPDWELSSYKSSKQILEAYGYQREDIRKLYCTVSSQTFNSQGLRLKMNDKNGTLVEYSSQTPLKESLVWTMDKLSERLGEKHAETFWVEADVSIRDGVEYFRFKSVEHTKGPLVSQLGILLNEGKVTMDHLIKEKGAGAVEKGPLFKLKHDALPLLFPPSKIYNLTE